MNDRFLTREQVADELNISMAQAYALIRRGEIRSLKIGGRGLLRIGREDLESYIERTYAATEAWITEHPFAGDDEPEGARTPGRRRSPEASRD